MTYDTISDAATMQAGAEGTLLSGRYRIVRQLGQGGMGSVWLAEDTQLDGKLFAIKMLPSILVSNKRAYRQLKDEALVAMKLTHPNIVQIRAFEENNGNPFLVMDYIDGETLDDYLAEVGNGEQGTGNGRAASTRPPSGGLPEDEVIRFLKPIAAALDYAHSKGVVHRDVKPGNVMIAKDGTPYILDFGIAREIQETMTRVTGKLSSGTLLYMSPEQLRGMKPQPGQDIYSFAAMAYECLKGEPPFSRGQIEYQILNEQPEPLTGGTRLVASVMAGLSKKPEDRPQTCAAVLEGDDVGHEEHVERAERTESAEQAKSIEQTEPRAPAAPQATDTCTPSTWKIPIASHKVKFRWTSWWGILAELMVLTCVAGWLFGLIVMMGVVPRPYIDCSAEDWNRSWIIFTLVMEVISVIVYLARHALWQLVSEKSWLFRKLRHGARKILVIANFVWIICLSLVLDYSNSRLYEIDGVKYSRDTKNYIHNNNFYYRFYGTRDDFVFVKKESKSRWIVRLNKDYHKRGNAKVAESAAPLEPDYEKGSSTKSYRDNGPYSKPIDKPDINNEESRDKSMDDCFRLKIQSDFENYIIGFLCLLGSVLCLWIPKSLVEFLKGRTQSVLQSFDATNWYNARRRIFFTFQNDPYMRFYRGVCALEGLGGRPRDMGSAQKLFRKAANQGMLEAFCALGYMSQHGLGCEVNLTEAHGYYSEARNLGCGLAAELLEDLNKERLQRDTCMRTS